MSASKNPPSKIAKFRTFAQDAEKHANNSIDEVRATHKKPNEHDQSTENQKTQGTEVVDLDSVDTSETTSDTTNPIPKKSDTKKEPPAVSDTTDTTEKDISNPPFHKLDAERKKAAEKISASSQTISNHPDSILSGDQKQTVQVDDDEATAGATIVTDTKIGRKSVLEDISDSVTGWFSDIKNTYITPPKPSYTVSKSERRAGILQDATPQTGADLVDHDSFAARIRERYQNATVQETTAVTEPAWLPSLPASDKRTISEVKTVPRKSVQTPAAETAAAKKKMDEKTVSAKPLPVAEADEKQDEVVATEPKKSESEDKSQTSEVKPGPESKETEPKETKSKETAATPEKETTSPLPTKPATANTTEESAPLPKPPTKEPEKPTPTAEQGQTEDAAPVATATEKPESTRESATATQSNKEKEETKPATTPAQPTERVAVAPEDYVLPSDEEIDAEAMWADRQATNKLSLGIVLGTTVAVVAGIIVYSIAPLFLDTPTAPATTVETPFTGTVTALAVNDWSDPLSRTQAVREAMDADISTMNYIALTNGTETITEPGTIAQLLTIEIPTAVQAAAHDLHVGNHRGTPFLYLHAPDTPQILGAMLAWETELSSDLGPVFPISDHSGTFVDMIIDETYDARVKVANDNNTTVTYLLVNDHVLITTTPEAAAAILSEL